MQEKQHGNIQMEKRISVRLIKMLLFNKAINQQTYDKVMKCYKGKKGGGMNEWEILH